MCYLTWNVEEYGKLLRCAYEGAYTLAVQAFYLARTGRPGPVLIDVPKDVQQQLAVPDWDVPMAISGYMQRLPQMPSTRVRSLLLHVVIVSSWYISSRFGETRRD